LETVVLSEEALPASRTVNILRQIAGSLNEAHQRGLIHRDIKPPNIMLCEQGGIPDFVKVLDFGLARAVEPLDGTEVTRTSLIMGTPSYLAPERITDPMTIDQRSDVYSFGAVGYYLLTGRHIYDASSTVDLMRQIVSNKPPRPSEVTGKEIPGDLEELIMCCLARRPEDRPATMQEVLISVAKIDASLTRNSHDV
jgi:serine/threonine-protein kinase